MSIQKKTANKADNLAYLKDFLMFFVEAMAINTAVHQDVDDLYKTNGRVFCEYAKNSSLFNHPIIIGGGISHEEYGRKALGIMLYTTETKDRQIGAKIDRIIQRGWPRAYYHSSSPRKAEIEKYLVELRKGFSQNTARNTTELFIF